MKIDENLYKYLRSAIPMTDDCLRAIDKNRLMGVFITPLMGMREDGGANRGKVIDMIEAQFGMKGQSYCMMEQQTGRLCVERFLGISSPLKYTASCMDLRQSAMDQSLYSALPVQYGWMLFQDGNTAHGHVGFTKEIYGNEAVMNLEGNTAGGTAVVANGDISTVKFRSTIDSHYSKSGLHPVGWAKIFK